MAFEKPLYKWKKPKELKFKLSDCFRSLKLFLWAYLIGFVIILLVYAYLKSIGSDEFDKVWDDIFIRIIPGSFGLILFILVIGVIQSLLDFTTYQISEKGIHSSSMPNWFLKWSKIQGFWIESLETNEEIQTIVFLSGKQRRNVPLPQDNKLSELIVQMISQRISQIPPVEKSTKFIITNSQGVFLVLLTLVYSYALAYVSSPYGFIFNLKLHPSIETTLLFSVFILGPGTIGLAILAKGKWSEFRKGISYAYFINMAAFFLVMFFLTLLTAKHYLNLARM